VKSQTILLVEDDHDDLELTLRTFRGGPLCHQVVVARNGLEALDYLFSTGAYADQNPEPPTLVLLDLNLPKLSGLEVLQKIKNDERTRRIPVAVLSSSQWDLLSAESLRPGAVACLVKPVNREAVNQLAGKLGIPEWDNGGSNT
jgi:two-component system response regulator